MTTLLRRSSTLSFPTQAPPSQRWLKRPEKSVLWLKSEEIWLSAGQIVFLGVNVPRQSSSGSNSTAVGPQRCKPWPSEGICVRTERLCTHGNGSASRALGRCFDDESHNKHCNRNGSTEVSNVRVESFHAASVVCMSLLFFLSPVAKA